MREALFSIWQPRIESCRFLDLFAGSGTVGIEAISRGARRVVFVEGSPRVLETLRRNAGELAPEIAQVRRARLPAGLDRLAGERFDLIFADPPYAFSDHGALLERMRGRLAGGGEMAIEHSARLDLDPLEPWLRRDRRRYGDSCLSFFRLEDDSTETR